MGLRIKKSLGIRSDSTLREPNKKFIFVFEGEKTEKQYFQSLDNYRSELGIDDIIAIEPLERDIPQQSNQLKVVEELLLYLENIKNCKKSLITIKSHIISILQKESFDSYEDILKLIETTFVDTNYRDRLNEFIDKLEVLLGPQCLFGNFIEKIKEFKQSMEYEPDFDEICVIIDRDKRSFKDFQYDEVLKICEENNYNLGITNPCFEFWLLLHLTDCSEYSQAEILENKRASKRGKNFLETCLTKKLGSYKKNNVNFDLFKDKIHVAILNAHRYCEDVQELKDNIGSTVGIILNMIVK